MRKKGCKYQQNDPRAVCADRNFIDRRIFWFTKGNIFCETCRGKMDSGWRRLRRTRWRFIDIENPCWLRVWWGGMRRGSNGGRKIIVIIWKIVNRVEKSVGSEMITVVCRPTDSYVVWRTLIETLTRFVCAYLRVCTLNQTSICCACTLRTWEMMRATRSHRCSIRITVQIVKYFCSLFFSSLFPFSKNIFDIMQNTNWKRIESSSSYSGRDKVLSFFFIRV